MKSGRIIWSRLWKDTVPTNCSGSTRGFYEFKFNMSLTRPILFSFWLMSVFSGFPLLPCLLWCHFWYIMASFKVPSLGFPLISCWFHLLRGRRKRRKLYLYSFFSLLYSVPVTLVPKFLDLFIQVQFQKRNWNMKCEFMWMCAKVL